MTATVQDCDGEPTGRLAAQRLVPVLRSASPADAIDTARACALEGLSVVELTTSVPDALAAIRTLTADGLLVGLGTVRSAEQVHRAADAGAAFVVSPVNPPGFVAAALDRGLLPVPGAFTVSEIWRACDDGAGVVKVFPAAQSSPSLIGDLAPVLPGVRIIPTGGLDAAGLRAWLDAGALAVGVGSALGTVASIGTEGVRARVRELRAATDRPAPLAGLAPPTGVSPAQP